MTGHFFITGTDTGVGKTRVSAALLWQLAQRGLKTAGYKPVAAGMEEIDGQQINEDVYLLHAVSSAELSVQDVCTYQFKAACAPHIAAAQENQVIERSALKQQAERLAARVDHLIVEGVGGFRVPLGPDWDSADLARDLNLPVILVIGLRLGCLNHALLTADAIQARGLHLAGWIGNQIDPQMPHLPANLQTLTEALAPAPCLGIIPWLAQAHPEVVAQYLKLPL